MRSEPRYIIGDWVLLISPEYAMWQHIPMKVTNVIWLDGRWTYRLMRRNDYKPMFVREEKLRKIEVE